jgi:hypothetical protein
LIQELWEFLHSGDSTIEMDTEHGYLRLERSSRLIEDSTTPCVVLSHVIGSGGVILRGLLEFSNASGMSLYVEDVVNPVLEGMLVRRGFQRASSRGVSYYYIPQIWN